MSDFFELIRHRTSSRWNRIFEFRSFLFEAQVDEIFNLFWFGSFWDWYFENFRPKFKSKDLSPDLSDCWGRTRVEDEHGFISRSNVYDHDDNRSYCTNRTHFTTFEFRNIHFGVSCYKWSFDLLGCSRDLLSSEFVEF